MHDCYQLGIIDHDTLTSFLRFCVQFWMGHYRMKKQQQFDMSQREIEEEKKKLDAIIAEKEAWEKWDNSTPRVLEKTIKKLEEMGEQLEKEFAATSSSS
jgi:L-lactate utilization protein LutB